ncbi:MAG: FtsW/RodA/SpoVE family cell cycle protein [Bacteroides sp.]|nr:FtsW/RodA/SpoVE family cell cycle protein [Bacteroides sp.]MCM1413767.1 FtsW/RodA/SpoVE family cell cycle protein [Bacteroides sp.]MCM1472214.1 FtsW/RodA/SpoVE family cell cycle protein [Bacteroides sp.]
MESDSSTIINPIQSAAPAVQTDAASDAPVAKGDKHIWGIYIFLILISVIELYSASSREVSTAGLGVYGTIVRHVIQLFMGLCIIYYLQKTHYRKILKWVIPFTLLSVALMGYTMFFGEVVNGARRNFHLMGISIQPSELLKISAAMMTALIMSRTQVKGGGVSNKGIIWSAAVILLFCAMLAPQGLTNTLLLISISMSMMIIGGTPFRKVGYVIVVYVACFSLYVGVQMIRHAHAANATKTEQTDGTAKEEKSDPRFVTWITRLTNFGDSKPKYEQEMTSDNQQEMLGYMAQAHGGVFGVMPGHSRETSRLPLAFTDYIYSIIVEEMGLIGGLFVLVLYLWLLGRASAIASRCSRAFPALLVIGMALTIVFQALFHICIVTGVIPVSGQPLPLISKGGCSILVTSIAFGIMLSVSRFAVRTGAKNKEIRQEIDSLPEDMRADNPSQL